MNKIRKSILALTLVVTLTASAGSQMGCSSSDREYIPETAAAVGGFDIFLTALAATDMDQALRGIGPYTVFAPVDEAFAALPPELLEELLLLTPVLTAILQYHVVFGEYTSDDLATMSGETLTTMLGQTLLVTVEGGIIFVNGVPVIDPDDEASNGIIHAIGGILFPDLPGLEEILP